MDVITKEILLKKIGDAVENIRPYLIADGGDVNVLDLDEDYVVHVELLGSCESCPMSPMTMKAGIEEAVKRAVPEVKHVNAVNVASVD
jgi:Fe-S cluster biogenesis protein NfuA